jgi:hypothetical protein
MTIATNALVNTGISANPLVIAGQTEKAFQDVIRFESEETLMAVKQELESNLEGLFKSGVSRFSDLVESVRTKLTILEKNLGISY